MKTIILTGRLGKKFGRTFKFDVASPAEAVRALCTLIDGFEQEIRKGAYRIIKQYQDGNLLSHSENDLALSFGERAHVLRIEPAKIGAKSGIFNVILGVVLVGAAFLLTGGTLAATAFTAFGYGVTGGQLALVGGLMALSGVSSMLASTMMQQDSETEPSSFMISSPTNWAEQGHPVPLVYGYNVFCGSVVVSSGINTEDFDPDE